MRQPHSGTGGAGQALVEFALIVPVFLLILLGILDVGRLYYTSIILTNVARESARVAASLATFTACNPACVGAAQTAGGNVAVGVGINPSTDITITQAGPPPLVTASVSFPFQALTPGIRALIGDHTLTASTTTPVG